MTKWTSWNKYAMRRQSGISTRKRERSKGGKIFMSNLLRQIFTKYLY